MPMNSLMLSQPGFHAGVGRPGLEAISLIRKGGRSEAGAGDDIVAKIEPAKQSSKAGSGGQ